MSIFSASDGTAVIPSTIAPETIAPETIGMQDKDRVLAELGTISRLATRRFTSPALAGEAVLHVLDALEKDNWQRVRDHAGPGPFAIYLASLSWRLMEDFARRRFGRRRPPLWIRALGGIHALLFRLLCLERLDLNAAVELVAQRQESPTGTRSRRRPGPSSTGSSTAAPTRPSRSTSPRPTTAVRITVPSIASRTTTGTVSSRPSFPGCSTAAIQRGVNRTHTALRRLRLELSAEERLLLQLCYRDNLSVTRAGELLDLNRHQVHGRLRRLLARLRQGLEQAGLAAELRELLD